LILTSTLYENAHEIFFESLYLLLLTYYLLDKVYSTKITRIEKNINNKPSYYLDKCFYDQQLSEKSINQIYDFQY